MLRRLPKLVELSKYWGIKNFKYCEPGFCSRLFDNFEEVPFSFFTGSMKVFVIIKLVPGAPKLCVFQEIQNDYFFY